jgi:predicted PurR-regulated permease PerM
MLPERPMVPERVVEFRPRTIAVAAGTVLAIAAALWVLYLAHRVLTWVLISAFLALAMDPAVRSLQRRGIRSRAAAAGVVYLIAFAGIAALAALFIPTLVSQVNDFVDAVPGYVRDLTHGRGSLGFLETKYHVVERVQKAVDGRGADGASTALSVGRTLVTGVAATVTIIFMTFFMLLEGPSWLERFYGVLPRRDEARWRAVGHDIARTVSGYVTGNLLISLVAGTTAAIVLALLGVPFSIALGLLVFVLDLIPLAGATIGAIVCVLVALTVSTTTALVVLAWFVVYQQLENHLLQPLIYGRTVQLSPLAVLISVLVGAELAGVVGALAAIPVAGTIQILLVDWWRHRQRHRHEAVLTPTARGEPAEPPFTPAT